MTLAADTETLQPALAVMQLHIARMQLIFEKLTHAADTQIMQLTPAGVGGLYLNIAADLHMNAA